MPTTPIRDITCYFEENGSGDPLVLIMGLGGDLQAWAFQMAELPRTYRTVVFDNRGSGRSAAPDKPYSIAGMAQDVAALMDHLGIAKAHILGYSMGGYIAQEFALANPARVNKLILLATAPSTDAYGKAIFNSWIDIRRSNMSREQVARSTAPWHYSAALLADPVRSERSVQNALNNPYPQQDHGFIRQAQALINFDAESRLGAIKAPTLVVASKDDILIPPRNSEKLAKLIPGAKLVELPGPHFGVIENAVEYNAAFLTFLKGD